MSKQSNTRSQYFRITYSNAFTIKFNGSEATIVFSTLNDLGNPSGGSEDQIEIGMHASNLKALGVVISALVKRHEELAGIEIPMNERVSQEVNKILSQLSPNSKS